MTRTLSTCGVPATLPTANMQSARSASRSASFASTRPLRAASHSAGMYVVGDTHTHTNTIEGFFGPVKPSIRGTYRKVLHRWLQGYLNEFT